jgi:hypothetical protein
MAEMCELVQVASWDRGVYEGEWLTRRYRGGQETLYWTLFLDAPDDHLLRWAVYSKGALVREVVYDSASGPWGQGDLRMELDSETQQLITQLEGEGWRVSEVQRDEIRGVIYGARTSYLLER